MLKAGMFVVPKGKDNPWIYRIQKIDARVNCAFCQFVGHNGKLREDAKAHAGDKWKSLEEISQAKSTQLVEGLLSKGDKFIDLEKKLNVLGQLLDGIKIPNGLRIKKVCEHEWKEYNGFRWNYSYCTKCDAKNDR
jgi:hypothetical protein